MRSWLLILIFLVGSFPMLTAQEFGQSPDALILTFDMRGGQKPRTQDGPVLQIYANGMVTTRATKPGDPPLNTHLSEEELIEFFNELVDDTDILNVTTASIEREVKMHQPQLRQFPDAPVTLLSINLPNGNASISIKGVSALAYLVPEASSLQSLFSAQRRLLDFAKQANDKAK